MRRILFLARAEVLHIVRDRTTMLQILVLPILQLLVLVNAATFVIRDAPTHLVDHDRSMLSRELTRHLEASGFFRIRDHTPSMERAEENLLAGDVVLVVTIPPEFEADLVRGGAAAVQLIVSGEQGSAAAIVQSYASRILSRYAAELAPVLARRGSDVQAANAVIDVRARSWYNPTLNYKHYMVPGVLVGLVTIIATLLSAQNIAREKELGTLEQLNVTPIAPGEFIAAKLLPLWVLGLIDLALGLVVGRLVFDVPMRGSVALLFLVAAIYLVGALAVGLLISTIVETQQQAMFITFFVMNVYLLLSGLFTPVDSMAPWVRVVSQINPVRHFVAISRAILVRGAGPAEIAQPLMILAGFAFVMVTLAVLRYRKTAA